jgi:endonuclease-8
VRVVIETADWVAVCFNAPVVETFREYDIHRHPGFGRLGPDLVTASKEDLELCARRIYDYPEPEAPIAEVLLDQHVACGVGNVYRSEILWACEISPFAHVHTLHPADCVQIISAASRMLRANIRSVERVTQPDIPGGLAVYGRNGQRCARCSDTVAVKRLGEHARLVYWCPGCQVKMQPMDLTPPSIDRAMDPHPAAAKYLSELPWRRDATG